MLNGVKLVVDCFSEVYDYLLPCLDDHFYDLQQHVDEGKLQPGACYVIGRNMMRLYSQQIRELIESNTIRVVFSNAAEGSDTLRNQCRQYHIHDLVINRRIPVISGGDLDSNYHYILYENFAVKVLDFDENKQAMTRSSEIFSRTHKPYQFLFLNGRHRSHRKYLLERFQQNGLLDHSLWTNLDTASVPGDTVSLWHREHSPRSTQLPICLLPQQYEVDRYRHNLSKPVPSSRDMAVKRHLFSQEWGEIYINPDAYIDTYFSLVTETVFVGPGSFRTEKIWKPVAMAHPFVVAANAGFYRDLHNLGFHTFDHLIDESFDDIDNHQDRVARLAQVVEDLVKQDLDSFLHECREVCEYNQQHLINLRNRVKADFGEQLERFLLTITRK